MNKIFVVILLTLLAGCNSDVEPIVEADTARYKVDFNLNWNSTVFPIDYPANDHFSKLIGWSHSTNTTFFVEGTMASEGIKRMAELGSTNPLNDEINDKILNGEGLMFVEGNGLGSGVGTISIEVKVSEDYPLVTLSTMIAPSPDWYAAIVHFDLLEGDEFIDVKTTDILVYDAGTDSGLTYASANEPNNPQIEIAQITQPPLGNGIVVTPAIGSVTFTKIQ